MKLFYSLSIMLIFSCASEKLEDKINCGFEYTITEKSITGGLKDDVKFEITANTHIADRDGLIKLCSQLIKSYPEYKKYNSFNFYISAQNSKGEFVKTIFTQYKIGRAVNGHRTFDINSISGENKFIDNEGNIWSELFIGVNK